jgi:two-component system LytT family response regulator
MMRALVVDDEVHAREELAAMLAETGELTVVGKCGNALEAVQAIHAQRPEVLFLDVQMPMVSGFELLGMIDEEEMPAVVFVTAYDEFAVKAFEENASDYLLKPVARERLAKTVEKLRKLPRDGARPVYASPRIERIPCVGRSSIKLVETSEVEYAKSSEAGVYVVCARGEYYTDLTLKVLEERAGLVRCHKQYLVNIDRADEISLGDDLPAVVKTKSGATVPVSRRYLAKLKERLGI